MFACLSSAPLPPFPHRNHADFMEIRPGGPLLALPLQLVSEASATSNAEADFVVESVVEAAKA